MTDTAYFDGMAPAPATGPWTGMVDEAARGTYLVKRADNGEYDVFLCDGDGAWIDMRYGAERETPIAIAMILPEATV